MFYSMKINLSVIFMTLTYPVFSFEQVNNFLADGFLIIPNLLDAEETGLLLAAATADPMMKENFFDVSDRKGQTSQMTL